MISKELRDMLVKCAPHWNAKNVFQASRKLSRLGITELSHLALYLGGAKAEKSRLNKDLDKLGEKGFSKRTLGALKTELEQIGIGQWSANRRFSFDGATGSTGTVAKSKTLGSVSSSSSSATLDGGTPARPSSSPTARSHVRLPAILTGNSAASSSRGPQHPEHEMRPQHPHEEGEPAIDERSRGGTRTSSSSSSASLGSGGNAASAGAGGAGYVPGIDYVDLTREEGYSRDPSWMLSINKKGAKKHTTRNPLAETVKLFQPQLGPRKVYKQEMPRKNRVNTEDMPSSPLGILQRVKEGERALDDLLKHAKQPQVLHHFKANVPTAYNHGGRDGGDYALPTFDTSLARDPELVRLENSRMEASRNASRANSPSRRSSHSPSRPGSSPTGVGGLVVLPHGPERDRLVRKLFVHGQLQQQKHEQEMNKKKKLAASRNRKSTESPLLPAEGDQAGGDPGASASGDNAAKRKTGEQQQAKGSSSSSASNSSPSNRKRKRSSDDRDGTESTKTLDHVGISEVDKQRLMQDIFRDLDPMKYANEIRERELLREAAEVEPHYSDDFDEPSRSASPWSGLVVRDQYGMYHHRSPTGIEPAPPPRARSPSSNGSSRRGGRNRSVSSAAVKQIRGTYLSSKNHSSSSLRSGTQSVSSNPPRDVFDPREPRADPDVLAEQRRNDKYRKWMKQYL
ncbi:unnamed protein product [Amoebophrya sp. A25]|nr:unnamed protein product [Amoebophrya sp. A25]|eukprot:GSA25T00018528001.1